MLENDPIEDDATPPASPSNNPPLIPITHMAERLAAAIKRKKEELDWVEEVEEVDSDKESARRAVIPPASRVTPLRAIDNRFLPQLDAGSASFIRLNDQLVALIEKEQEIIQASPIYYLCAEEESLHAVRSKYYLPHEWVKITNFYKEHFSNLNALKQKVQLELEALPHANPLTANFLDLITRIDASLNNLIQLDKAFIALKFRYLGSEDTQKEALQKFTDTKESVLLFFKNYLMRIIDGIIPIAEVEQWFETHQFTVLSCIAERMRFQLYRNTFFIDVAKLLVFYWLAEHPAQKFKHDIKTVVLVPNAINTISDAIGDRDDAEAMYQRVLYLVAGFAIQSPERLDYFAGAPVPNPINNRVLMAH